jgi:hypothetical protein
MPQLANHWHKSVELLIPLGIEHSPLTSLTVSHTGLQSLPDLSQTPLEHLALDYNHGLKEIPHWITAMPLLETVSTIEPLHITQGVVPLKLPDGNEVAAMPSLRRWRVLKNERTEQFKNKAPRIVEYYTPY